MLAKIYFDLNSLESYRQFLEIKKLPVYRICGRIAEFPAEYAERLNIHVEKQNLAVPYSPSSFCFDYQKDITALALKRRKFAIFADCGLGKTLIYLEWLRALAVMPGGALIISPLMVVSQTIAEAQRFYPDMKIERIPASGIKKWLKTCDGKIGITNYEAFKQNDLSAGQLGKLVVDESSTLKSHYGKYGTEIVRLGRQVDWVLCGTGTPAPNDRIEYANHAVLLGHYPSINSFLATFFINRGQTQERWVLKDHAIGPFYRHLSHWSIFLTNPANYGWKDNCETIPPIHIHIDSVPMTDEQHAAVFQQTGYLVVVNSGGIVKRSILSKIAKGIEGSATRKYHYIRSLINSWPDESTIIWCWANKEQDILEECFPEAASIRGATPYNEREKLIDEFKSGRTKLLISKPKVLGFGLNLQIATRQIFSSLIDSYEQFYQAVKRSNRYGSIKPLNVHIPVLDLERPMVDTVLRKAQRIKKDTEIQEGIFKQWIF